MLEANKAAPAKKEMEPRVTGLPPELTVAVIVPMVLPLRGMRMGLILLARKRIVAESAVRTMSSHESGPPLAEFSPSVGTLSLQIPLGSRPCKGFFAWG